MATTLQHYAASVYGTEEAADCRLRFYVSQAHTEQEQSGQADPGAGSSGTATAAQLQQPSRTFVGEPLPAHSLILRGTSLRLRALLSRWTDEDDQPRSGGSLPELHVLLDAAEDLGPASEVVRFCYTGQLTELDFHALLLVQRQASYLQVCSRSICKLIAASLVPCGPWRLPSSAKCTHRAYVCIEFVMFGRRLPLC